MLCCPRCAVLGARVVVAEGGEDVTIKVSDEGGGIPRSGLASIWTYLYSTAKSQVKMETLQVRSGHDYSIPDRLKAASPAVLLCAIYHKRHLEESAVWAAVGEV